MSSACHEDNIEPSSAVSMNLPLESVPLETQNQIFSYLKQRWLLSLTLTSKSLSAAATTQLYARPKFSSTYRFAQFVTIISHSKPLATMVHSFSLSHSHEEKNHKACLAGWMEWKYRGAPAFSAQTSQSTESGESDGQPMHPVCNPTLRRAKNHEAGPPLGAILHVLTACKNLTSVALPS